MPTSDDLDHVRRWFNTHVGLALTMSATVVVAIRVSRVSHGSLTTAYALLGTVGTAPALLALLISTLPAVGACGFVVFVRSRHQLAPLDWLAALASLSIAFTLFVPTFVVAGVMTLITGSWFYRRRSGKTGSDRAAPSDVRIFLTVSVLVLVVVYPSAPWLPPEAITIGTDDPITGYVIAEDPKTLRVLRDDTRTVFYLPVEDVEARELCSVSGWRWQQPLAYTIRKPNYPDCP